jgi:hypothetical protein
MLTLSALGDGLVTDGGTLALKDLAITNCRKYLNSAINAKAEPPKTKKGVNVEVKARIKILSEAKIGSIRKATINIPPERRAENCHSAFKATASSEGVVLDRVRFLAMVRITVKMRLSSKHNHVIKNGEHNKSTAQNYCQAHIFVCAFTVTTANQKNHKRESGYNCPQRKHNYFKNY